MSSRAGNNDYILELNDRLCWNLAGTDSTRAWLKRFAATLNLEAGSRSGLPEIMFVRGATAAESLGPVAAEPDLAIISALSEEGWRYRDLLVLRIWSRNDQRDIFCELLNTQAHDLEIMMMSQSLYPAYGDAIGLGGLPLHAALLELDGQAVLLAGSSGSGKSTCCRRVPAQWRALSEDEALVLDHHSGVRIAHPLPTWKDCLIAESPDSCTVTASVRLAAIFFLDGWNADSVSETGPGEAAIRINRSAEESCSMLLQYLDELEQEEWRRKLFENACALAESIPAYSLQVSATGRFWEHIEAVLTGLRLPSDSDCEMQLGA